jgi:hypothetical protein
VNLIAIHLAVDQEIGPIPTHNEYPIDLHFRGSQGLMADGAGHRGIGVRAHPQSSHRALKCIQLALCKEPLSGRVSKTIIPKLDPTRDRIGQFSFTFDHAAHTGKKNFKPVPPEPKPELSWAESRLAAVRESLDFCRGASIHVTDAQIEDEKYWSGVVEAENAAKKSPAAKEIDAEIARLDDEIAKLKAKSS